MAPHVNIDGAASPGGLVLLNGDSDAVRALAFLDWQPAPPVAAGQPPAMATTQAKYTWEWSRNVQIRSSVIYQAANGSPKRLPMAPRTVLGPGYTGWCLACLEAAVVSTGGRSRTPPVGSRRARRTAHSTLQQAIVALASRRLSQSFPPQAVWQAWTARYGRALPSRREQGEPLSRRRRVPREGPLGHVVRRRGASECQRVVLRHVQPWTRAAGTASSKLGVDGPGHERAHPGRFPLEPAPLRRTGGLLLLSC